MVLTLIRVESGVVAERLGDVARADIKGYTRDSIDGRHWPIGTLFDLHTAFEPSSLVEGMEHPHLPWNLTVHFQEYPKDILTRRESPQSLQDLWLNNLKEVPFLPLVHFEHPPSNLSSHLPLFSLYNILHVLC